MPTNLLPADTADIKLLRAAAQKIRDCEIPHVISEERWTGRSATDIKGIVYEGRRSFDLFQNLRMALDWLKPQTPNSLSSMILNAGERESKYHQTLTRLRLVRYGLTRVERNLPDAEVDGNLVHWSEHAMHIALWSPVVAKSVATFLDAEADAREEGLTSTSSAAAVALAKDIKKKKVWDNSLQTPIPRTTWTSEVASMIPAVKKEARRRLSYMYAHDADHTVARALYAAYGAQRAPVARKNAQRMLQRAQKAVESSSVKAADRKVWKTRVKACEVFLASLDAR